MSDCANAFIATNIIPLQMYIRLSIVDMQLLYQRRPLPNAESGWGGGGISLYLRSKSFTWLVTLVGSSLPTRTLLLYLISVWWNLLWISKSVVPYICPYRNAVPNRRTSPSSNRYSRSIKGQIHTKTPQMPNKTSKGHQETVKFKRHSGPFGCRTCTNRHFLVNEGPHGSCLPYMASGTYICIYVYIYMYLRYNTHKAYCRCWFYRRTVFIISSAWLCQQSSWNMWNRNSSVCPSVASIISEVIAWISFKF